MRHLRKLCVAIALVAPACATTSTTTTTWTEPAGAWARSGHVESVREVVQRVRGNPVGGALAGALIGGLLFHGHGPATLFGAATGAAIGAAASQGSGESRTYQVLVRFDDGDYGMFAFGAAPPFAPGDRVVLTPQGLSRG
ncbi:MAG TPA: hypothetical protein VIV58_14895 [Kofleriaceae bacterium]